MKARGLGEPLSNAVLAALLHVARADGIVNAREVEALHAIAAEVGLPFDAEDLFFTDVDGAALAATIRLASGTPGVDAAALATLVGGGFVAWAHRVAFADGELAPEEIAAIEGFVAALATHR